jgi:broad specificity phosphatase PhoE
VTGRAVYFISHPDVVVSAEVPVTQWPLSATGIGRMRGALAQPWVRTLSALYSSAETKAVDAVRILAADRGLPWTEISALGEIDRAATGFLPPPEFERVADAFFAQPETSVRGWERAVDAQRRIVAAVAAIVRDDASAGAIGIVSHGAVGALLYCALTGARIDRRFDQPHRGGCCYLTFPAASPHACAWWRPIDAVAERACHAVPRTPLSEGNQR